MFRPKSDTCNYASYRHQSRTVAFAVFPRCSESSCRFSKHSELNIAALGFAPSLIGFHDSARAGKQVVKLVLQFHSKEFEQPEADERRFCAGKALLHGDWR